MTRPQSRPLDGQLRLITRVARMYHEKGYRQAEIAESLHISQAKVSRLLKRAIEVGIVRTTVMVAPGLCAELEDELEQKFGITEAVVVEIDEAADERDTIAAVGAAAAAHLRATLSGDDRVGISTWSQTLMAMVDRMQPLSTRGALSVAQLLGGIGVAEVQSHSHRLLGDMARVLGADAVYVQAPGVVAGREIRDSLLADQGMRDVVRAWKELTLAVVGIGSIDPTDVLAESGNAFTDEELQFLRAEHAVGDICHRTFRLDGSAVTGHMDDRIIAIESADFLRVPRRIGVAGGPRKIDAIRGALAGEWVTTLVTDDITARALLAQ
ncbi:sugar-binding transcriptional regulator [Microbacterium sp. YY-01]|uniref:sugar-binding transcriptional regulator n=1 Tax=Microbacterium sp. YY-01 TaxID=3421634 RepID=UPI003D17BE36